MEKLQPEGVVELAQGSLVGLMAWLQIFLWPSCLMPTVGVLYVASSLHVPQLVPNPESLPVPSYWPPELNRKPPA